MYKINDFAQKAGVTVRTLHHYNRLGLLNPSGRTTAGYRLYSERDFARLQQIVTLKFIGLPLRQIKALLDGTDLDFKQTLRMQRRLLEAKRWHVGMAIQAIDQAAQSLQSGSAPDLAALKKIVEIMERQNTMEWAKKYYSEEAQATIAEKSAAFTPEMQVAVTENWNQLIRDIEAAIRNHEDPAGANARALAERWSSLVSGFTGGDPEIQKGLNKLYADQENWPATFQKPFSDEVQEYMRKAMKAHRISCA
ncbi:MAG TPA: MerR family transcriptional regulator [Candidatus Angelobacter sp.]|nr:MerR family transcriptional regulator [Candidatus Angelobacter sp.]